MSVSSHLTTALFPIDQLFAVQVLIENLARNIDAEWWLRTRLAILFAITVFCVNKYHWAPYTDMVLRQHKNKPLNQERIAALTDFPKPIVGRLISLAVLMEQSVSAATIEIGYTQSLVVLAALYVILLLECSVIGWGFCLLGEASIGRELRNGRVTENSVNRVLVQIAQFNPQATTAADILFDLPGGRAVASNT